MENVTNILKKQFRENVRFDVQAGEITSFKSGGNIKTLVIPRDFPEIKFLYDTGKETGLPVKFLGSASNVLISDKGFNGIVCLSGAFNGISIENGQVLAGSGVKINQFLRFLLKNSLGGAEFLAGIPGSVGGALCTNAGTKTASINSILEKVKFIDNEGNPQEKRSEEILSGYRRSSLKGAVFFVSSAWFRLEKENAEKIRDKIKNYMETRIKTQPLGFPSAGSVFKNPEGRFAGKLIEDAGLKGFRTGGAEISRKHANFIVNAAGASSSDIYSLIQLIRERVLKKYNISLELEIETIGEF